MISSTGQGGHTRTTLDLFSRCRQVDPVTITTLLGRLEMLEYCCMVVLFYLRQKKKRLNFGRHRTNYLFVFVWLYIFFHNGSDLNFFLSVFLVFPPQDEALLFGS